MNFYYWLGYHLSRLLARLFFGFRIIHRERVIPTGPVILAMNHQSFFDPPLAGNACDRPIFFLAKKSLMNVPVLGWLLPKLNVIPVNLEGGDRSALKALIRILSAGDCALVFPEGSRTPDGNLHPALPGLGLLITLTGTILRVCHERQVSLGIGFCSIAYRFLEALLGRLGN